MKKILILIKQSFLSNSNNIEYRKELIVYFIFLCIYLILGGIFYFVDKDNEYYTGVILAICFVMFLWQTGALVSRLYEVKVNKSDLKIINGEYNFKCESVEINYRELKKILRTTTGGFKLYCKGINNKSHIIRARVLFYRNKQKIERKYYFDRVEYELGKVLMLINEHNLVNNSKVFILGNDIAKKNNVEFVKHLLKKYV